MVKTDILLESGTNEIEIIKFTIHNELYGINVAKVREIMMSNKAKPVPHSHKAVEGIFKPRDTIFTVVDLPYFLSGLPTDPGAKDLFMITNFNKINIAFRVHTVVGIQRLSWEDIEKPDITLSNGSEGIATGIARIDDELIVILDFEKIVAEIAPETSFQIDVTDEATKRAERTSKILMAEDSMLLTELISKALTHAGYVNLLKFNNGQELWNYLKLIKKQEDSLSHVDLVITDIEMPQMDGHRLTKLIKEDEVYRGVPVVIFSSLINREMEIKGKELGADAQLTKPEIDNLVSVIDRLVARNKK